MTKIPNRLHKYVPSMLLFLLFEAVAVTLWLTKDNFFYLLNFSYIGACRETVCPAFRPVGGGQLYVAVPWRDFP